MGSSKSNQSTPQPVVDIPKPPSAAESFQQYLDLLPKAYQAQLDYGPKFAEADYQLSSQYDPLYSRLQYDIEQSLYPETAGLQENLAKQAREGMQEQVPEWARMQYQDTLRSELGPNAGSGIGADYFSRNMLGMQKSWQDYYRDLALSVTQRMPLQGAVNVPGRDMTGGLSYQNIASASASNYAPYVQALTQVPYYYQGSQRGGGFNWGGAASGAMSGARVGSMTGNPIGTVIGAGVGGFLGGRS